MTRTEYQQRKNALRCVWCNRAPAQDGLIDCAACHAKTLYHRRKAAGRCVHCNGRPTPGRVSCRACRQELRRLSWLKKGTRHGESY